MKLIIALCTSAFLFGCSNPTPPLENEQTAVAPLSDADFTYINTEKTYASSKVSFIIKEDGTPSIKILDPKADIEDLNNLCLITLRKEVYPKLRRASVTERDLKLLDFCFVVQALTGNTYSLCLLDSISIKASYPVSMASCQQTLQQLSKNYLTSSHASAKALKSFSRRLNTVSSEARANEYKFALTSFFKKDKTFERYKEAAKDTDLTTIDVLSNSLIFSESLVLSAILFTNETVSSYEKNELTPFLAFGKDMNTRELSHDWRTAASVLAQLEKNQNQVIGQLKAAIQETADADVLALLQDRYHLYQRKLMTAQFQAHIAFYDVPIILAYKKCFYLVISAKGNFNDDEDAIKKAALELSEMVMDYSALQCSPYTAQVFADLIKEMKDILSAGEYKEIQDTCKLFKHANEGK